MVLLAGGIATGCGKNNDANSTANNTTANNTTVNNTTVNNTTVNNTTVNNTTVNNTTVNNTTVNNTTVTNNTNTYTPFDWACGDLAQPTGAFADLVGNTFDINGGCVGVNPFERLLALCTGAVVTDSTFANWSGRMTILDDGKLVNHITADYDIETFVPAMCVTALGGGTCAGMAATLDGSIGNSATTCVIENTADCLCNITGPVAARFNGILTEVRDGVVTVSFLERQADDSYIRVDEEWEYEFDGTNGVNQSSIDSTSYSATVGADADACEVYCMGFMAACNWRDDIVTPYDDDADCMTTCAGFAAGADGDMVGDTTACRSYHTFAAADPTGVTNPDTHCPHAQEVPTAACVN